MRTREKFNTGWRFFPDDIPIVPPARKGQAYSQAKTERFLYGPASRLFPDTPDDYGSKNAEETCLDWQNVTLPHDYIINEPYDESENNAWGFKRYHPAWYRKHFTLAGALEGKRIVIYFEGVADRADVYLNGVEMLHTYEAHTPFEVDITDFVRFDEDNVLAIRVECGTCEGWWYQGGGIYANVWLETYDPIAIDRYGVFAYPQKTGALDWTVPIEVTVRNDSFEIEACEVRVSCPAFTSGCAQKLTVPARSQITVSLSANAVDPELWDTDNPKLYTLSAQVGSDTANVNIGFRDIRFDADKGCILNGRSIKLKGVCGHGDCGLTGLCVSESMHRYKSALIKQMGANAYRCSHYPQSEYFMDCLDAQGILVMAETRFFTSTPEGMHELKSLIKRDRNHPCVFLWSVGNEEPEFITSRGARIMRSLYAEAKKLDPYRPVITANDRAPEVATVYKYSDIIGVNYHMDLLDRLHTLYPDKPVLSTENTASGTTRGWYYNDVPALGRICGYDHDTNSYFLGREKTWKYIYDRPWLMGGMQWIAFEHRGEAAWPRVCSASGAVDLFLQKKDAFYQNMSFWAETPMIHLLPHWNKLVPDGSTVKVWAYTNCEEAELFVNGKSCGRVTVVKPSHAEWNVEYTPGSIKVVGYTDGTPVCEDSKITSGNAVRLKLIPENAADIKKGEQLLVSCIALDANGSEVPDAAPYVTFFTGSAGKVIATGSDNCDHVPQNSPVRKMYMGRISVLCGTCESFTLTALADGLESDTLKLEF